MKSYEVMYIINASLDEASKTALMEEMHGVITSFKGTIDNVDDWGLKEFAYEIDDMRKGYYVVTNFSVDTEGLNEFNRLMRINNNIVRYMVINNDEKK